MAKAAKKTKGSKKEDAANKAESAPRSKTPPTPKREWTPWIYCAALVVMAWLIYSPSLSGPFLLDDFDMQEPASAVRSGNPAAIRASGRPLLMYTFRLNYLVGGFEPFGYHAVSILLHALNGLLLFGFLTSLFARGRLDDLLAPGWQAVFRYSVPLLFVATPVHAESVAYISSRSELFATTFYFAGLWLFASSWRERFRWPTTFALLALMGCAVLSKQDKITLPVAIILIDYLFLARGRLRKMLENWPLYGLFAVGVLAALAIILPFLFRASTVSVTGGQSAEYLFTQFRMYPMYLRLLLAPIGLNADYDIAPSETLFDHFSWLGLVFILAAVAGLVWCARKRPLVAFGGFLFFLGLVPTSSIITIADFAAERRLYIPAAGFLIAAMAALIHYVRVPRTTLSVCVGGVVLAYSVLTFQRAQVWADPLALWQDTAEKSPEKYRPLTWLGLELNSRGRVPEAIEAWKRAEQLAIDDTSDRAHLLSNLGLAYANLKRYDKALDYYRQAVALSPDVAQFHASAGVALMRLGRDEEAWQAFEAGFKANRFVPELYRLRGQELYQKGRYIEAERDFRTAVDIRPEDTAARENLAAAQEMLRRTGQQAWPGPLPNEGRVYDDWVAKNLP